MSNAPPGFRIIIIILLVHNYMYDFVAPICSTFFLIPLVPNGPSVRFSSIGLDPNNFT